MQDLQHLVKTEPLDFSLSWHKAKWGKIWETSENLAKLRLLVGIGRFHWNQGEQEMCASQNMPVYIKYQTVSNSIYSNSDLDLWHNDPKINRVLPLPQGNQMVKFGKDPMYRTKVMWKRPCCQKFYL
jgi:hypothetical protein